MPENTNFHVELNNGTTEEGLKEAMTAAGLKVAAVREVTPIMDGYALTNLLARGIWEHETGQAHCLERNKDGCTKSPKHLAWEELSQDQQETFIGRYVLFVENCREEELMPDILLQDNDQFWGVALSVSSHDY